MTLYARNDMCSTGIPVSSGGCGNTHSRPVINGAPVKVWALDCLPCESFLSGAGKPKILKFTPGDAKAGIPARQEHVADMDPRWSSSPDAIPLTPDEQLRNATRTERGAQQLQMIQALNALRTSGIDVPAEALWLLEKELPAGVLKGTILCPRGHDNPGGVKFCGECAAPMDGREGIPAAGIPLVSLHVNTLRKKCRDQGLPDKGTKAQLIERLEGVSVLA
jgi:SAP domain